MARYSPYNRGMIQPEMVDTGAVPYISYQSEQMLPMMQQGMAQMQGRYDTAQAGIAKYLEEMGASKLRGPDRDYVINTLNENLEKVKGNVKDKYNGDYGMAVNEVLQGLSRAKSTLNQGHQAYEEEQKYLPLITKLRAENKLVTPKGYDPLSASAFDQGEFKGVDYNQIYERGDYEGWAQKNYSKAFQDELTQKIVNRGGLGNETDPYIIQQTVKGLSDKEIASRITDADAKKFIEDNKVFAIEYGNDIQKAKDYLTKTVQSQVAEQVSQDITANQLWKQKQKEGEPSGPTPKFFTIDDFVKQNPSVEKTMDNITYDKSGNIITDKKELTKQKIANGISATEEGIIRALLPMANVLIPPTMRFYEAKDMYENIGRGIKVGLLTSPVAREFFPKVSANALINTANNDEEAILKGYKKTIDNFKTAHGLTDKNDAETNKIFKAFNEYTNTEIGSLFTIGRDNNYDPDIMKEQFISPTTGFVASSLDLYIDGSRVDDSSKSKALENISNLPLKDALKNTYIDLAGETPGSFVGFITNKSGKDVRVEISAPKEIKKAAADVASIRKSFINGDTTKRALTIESPTYPNAVSYRVLKQIVPQKDGTYQIVGTAYLYDKDGKVITDAKGVDPETGVMPISTLWNTLSQESKYYISEYAKQKK